jgi:preprotein translocase subunit SecE
VKAWFDRIKAFLADTWAELKKTTWPPRREVYGTTVVVIVAVILTAIYLFAVDKLLSTGMNRLFAWFEQ